MGDRDGDSGSCRSQKLARGTRAARAGGATPVTQGAGRGGAPGAGARAQPALGSLRAGAEAHSAVLAGEALPVVTGRHLTGPASGAGRGLRGTVSLGWWRGRDGWERRRERREARARAGM